MSESKTNSSSGWGCTSIIVSILLLWAVFIGLPTPWGTFNIDLLPPRIWRMDAPAPRVDAPQMDEPAPPEETVRP
jgi:hypothetical protein